ncbi:MAG: hypothetical protein ABI534_02910 [Chloroflexota bacterium]
MSSPAVHLTDAQEERLQFVDREVDEAMQELERWLRRAPPDQPATAVMTDDERLRYDATRARLRALNAERESLRVQLFAERTEELRRQHLAATVADQELGRAAAARASRSHHSSGIAGTLKRLIGRE